MNGPDFKNSVQMDISGANVRDNKPVEKQSAEKKQKIADLKARVASGQYQVNVQTLAAKILGSGVLKRD